jgi:hypothetical protein
MLPRRAFAVARSFAFRRWPISPRAFRIAAIRVGVGFEAMNRSIVLTRSTAAAISALWR